MRMAVLRVRAVFNGISIRQKIKVKEADCTPSLKDERIPSQEESKKIFVSRDKKLRFAPHSWHFQKYGLRY